MNIPQRRRLGFTIVELLLVIVIVGVLATVTIVAFKGVTDRANATQALSLARSVATVVKLYQARNGAWPLAAWRCYGYASDFPAQDGFPAGSCGVRSSDGGVTWASIYDTQDSLMDQLAPYAKRFEPKIPIVSSSGSPVVGSYYYKFRGVVYNDYNLTTRNATVTYPVKGSVCPVPKVPMGYYYFSGGTQCAIEVSGVQ